MGAYSSGVLPITPDLVITGTIALDASTLPVTNDCLTRSDCSPQAGLILDAGVAGAVGEGDANLACGDSYARILLTGTTVRLRPYLRDTHPCRFNFTPVVEILPACGTACSEGQRMCPVDGVCYGMGVGYCQACEGGTKEACACQGPEGPLEEGAACSYWQSGDVRCDGTCRVRDLRRRVLPLGRRCPPARPGSGGRAGGGRYGRLLWGEGRARAGRGDLVMEGIPAGSGLVVGQ